MERYICIHGHFYQPPRENPWLEAIEVQDSAYPYHDWNERITAECYAPNGVSRILNGDGRIARIENNYARISFNFGPTLLSWLQDKAPDVCRSILDADRESQERFGGHGSALAQGYGHLIMPLANRRDKVTQVMWGIRDFQQRFGRAPEGMWLPEAAVDLETLDVLAEHGIKFTVLAPNQAAAVRRFRARNWHDVSGAKVDPSRAYEVHLPSKRRIAVFFYDGPISRAVAFEGLLSQGEKFAQRLVGGFSDARDWPQLVHIATDGESYGHHHRRGDMALAYALHLIEQNSTVRLTNYAEYLARHPPSYEARIHENSSWSCIHGIERWRSNCGCNTGRLDWSQAWRGPLREALDWLRDALAPEFERQARELLKDPWAARNDYIEVILDRSPDTIDRFLNRHAIRTLDEAERTTVLKLMELQRHALLMYTSCGWFFDELSGLETVQVIQYAGRAIQLGEELTARKLEAPFLERLERAKSNLPEQGDGRRIYDKWVKPTMLDWERVGAHYAISTLFETYPEQARTFCYLVEREDYQSHEDGKTRLAVGRARFTSEITRESARLTFGVVHFGEHNINGGVRRFQDEAAYQQLAQDLVAAFRAADLPEVIRHMDRGFGQSTYSLRSLFRDEQRKVIRQVLHGSLQEAETAYRQLYERHVSTMRFLAELSMPLPRAFQVAAEYLINADLRWEIEDDAEGLDLDRIRSLVEAAQTCGVRLDAEGIGHRLEKAMGRMADRLRADPNDLEVLERFERGVDLASSLPFQVNLWHPQNVYFELLRTAFPGQIEALERGGDGAGQWLDHLVALGDKLGIQVADLKKKLVEAQQVPTVPELVREVLSQRRVPVATYRLQFNPQFGFRDAQAVVPYLHELGISDVYASPILKPRSGSQHGYDICDHSRLNPELGEEDDFHAFSESLRAHGMGLILDMVPNHMGIGDPANGWWMDVLENGPSSVFASYFDIDWNPVNPHLVNKVLLPVLEDQYGKVLESGKIRIAYENGGFFFHYYDLKLPLAPGTYAEILARQLGSLSQALGEEHEQVMELQSILTAISYLPPRTETSPEKIEERNREKEVVKRRIAALCDASPEVRQAIDAALGAYRGAVGDPHSFDLLDALLEMQAYRPSFWRVATEEINFRRFFDINELAAIRMESPQVFQAAHQLVFRLLSQGQATGLRIDHPDGLWNPTSYFQRLQEQYVLERVRSRLPPHRAGAELEAELADCFSAQCDGQADAGLRQPLYVVAEKILGAAEPLPRDWAVDGTTGYDFLAGANALFVDSRHAAQFDQLYSRFAGILPDFGRLVNSTKKMIMLVSMASEINALAHRLDSISERNRRYRDFTLNSLTFVMREIIACLAVYRTYITGPDAVTPQDRMQIEEAVDKARRLNPRTARSIFDFVQDTLLLRNTDDFREEDRPALIDWTMKFQQLTGPIMAKGVEDTAYYVYNRLVSLNEVGGEPPQFGISPEEFHHQNAARLRSWPHSLLAGTTHDTKRSEDVRARINVLSEIPQEWQDALSRWGALNASKKTPAAGRPAPDRNDEYLLYQSLLGAWPDGPMREHDFAEFRQRIADYMQKATKEAKVHTSWVNPDNDYDDAVREFVRRLLPDDPDDPFRRDVETLARRVAYFGRFNSLSQTLLKLTCPGVPDFYQGTELWTLTLVDPDNRLPVDYQLRRELLTELKTRAAEAGDQLAKLAGELVEQSCDGRIKMYVTERALDFRRTHRALFDQGDYQPLQAGGDQGRHVCAFARSSNGQAIAVIVPRLIVGLTSGAQRPPLGHEVWRDTRVALAPGDPGAPYRNVFTGEILTPVEVDRAPCLPVADVLRHFPIALVERLETGRAGAP